MKYKILIIDDEEMILSMMEKCLKEKFSVYTANNAKKALALLNGRKVIPDIILLDINMPEMDGLELCQRIRSHISCPIIFLTARDDETDRLVGLNIGADDYVTKPFNVKELMARAHALLRRARGEVVQQSSQLIRGDLVIDKEKFTVTRDGKAVSLTPTEFNLLEVLASSPGRVFSRMQLMERAQGGYSFEGYERTIDTHIRNLRKKLERDAAHPEYILTVYGIGYKFGGTEYD